MTPSVIARTSRHPGRPIEGDILYKGSVYDRQLRPCRVYAVARCFPTYAEAMKWIA